MTGIVRMNLPNVSMQLGNPLFDEGDMNRPEPPPRETPSLDFPIHEQRQDWKTQRNTSYYKRSHVSLMSDFKFSVRYPTHQQGHRRLPSLEAQLSTVNSELGSLKEETVYNILMVVRDEGQVWKTETSGIHR